MPDPTHQPAPAHLFLAGALRRDRRECLGTLLLPGPAHPAVRVIDANRRSGGPYTVAGALMRALVPAALTERPDLVATHQVEILTAAADLRGIVPATQETLTSLAVPTERTRFYARQRTLRIAHGLKEFLHDLLSAPGRGPCAVVVDDLDHADPTDAEFVAVLLRRMDPAVLTVVAGGTTGLLDPAVEVPAEPGTPLGEQLHTALLRYCRRVDCAPAPAPAGSPGEPRALAAQYVAGDCRDDDPATLAAYRDLAPDERQRLHDTRADQLEAAEDPVTALGALPFHREHGSDPLGAGLAAMEQAMTTCVLHGFYDAVLDFCRRGRALTDWETTARRRWTFSTLLPTTLSALGRAEEAEAICDEARVHMRDPRVHMQVAYATAMLYTRHRAPGRRDHERATAWINTAIAISSLLPDARSRAFSTVFHHNGLALIEAHRGRPLEALELVTQGMAALDRELGEGEHNLHRSVLRHNRATVLTGLGRYEEALAELRVVIDADPYYPEYHLDLGNLLQRMGRHEEAAAAYDTVTRLGPPFPELYYNRGDLRNGQGDEEGALADFGYVLELDPGFVDAYVNRAGLLLDRGETDAAEHDIRAGLELAPDSPLLLAALGRLHADREETESARAAFDRALSAAPDLVAALCGRAGLSFDAGEADAALDDFGRAVEAAPHDPAIRYNRAFVLRSVGRWDEALADLEAAAADTPDDPEVREALEECRQRLTAV
ncbi:tetratricopeptide repeat protein [Streptomyces sp. NPDC020983]|uniref:tetratricopeptide repeat protein n=1 Tax=Streptomyces sp. NPDC020983 TaxID=3365106 RepID=UPI00378ECC1B